MPPLSLGDWPPFVASVPLCSRFTTATLISDIYTEVDIERVLPQAPKERAQIRIRSCPEVCLDNALGAHSDLYLILPLLKS